MIRSMTGFGVSAFDVEGAAFEVELRAVNHRHLDLRVRLPRGLAAFEPEVRALVRGRLARGKVDVSVRAAPGAAPADSVSLDLAAAEQYLHAARELEARHGLAGPPSVADLLALPGVARVVERPLSAEALRAALTRAVGAALDALEAMREAEGAALQRDLAERLDRIDALAGDLGTRADAVQLAVREKLRKRTQELARETGLLDEARLHQEVVLAADRLDVTEEVVRLRSHVEQFRAILGEAGPGRPVGRRLEFLLQEMGREANTIGSKGADASIAHDVVELKTELERVREQVQNVE